MPIQLLIKYFAQIGETWQIAPDIRAMVQYRPLNLLADFSHLGIFDVVFCRNVLIYFDQATKIDVLNRIAGVTEGDGYLLLGAAETVVGITDKFSLIADKRGLYAPNVPRARAAPRSRLRPSVIAAYATGWRASAARAGSLAVRHSPFGADGRQHRERRK